MNECTKTFTDDSFLVRTALFFHN